MIEKDKYLQYILKYVGDNIDKIFKPANGRFKFPFTDPGSIYNGDLWDWDSFWTVYALTAYEKLIDDDCFKKKLIESSMGNVLNFISFQLDDGYIPMVVNNSDNKISEEPYLIKKHREGTILNMHKPFLCQQACLASGLKGSYDWLENVIGNFERYFECYDRYYLNEKCGLYVWADDVMIGADNDPATFGRPRFSTANVFLNAFMVLELKAMAKILSRLGEHKRAGYYSDKASALSESIQKECYDPKDVFFYSVDIDIKTRSYDWFHKGLGVFWNSLPIKIQTWSGFIPLYAGIASAKQAGRIIKLHMENHGTFNSDYGIRSLARDEKMYNLDVTNNPSNWLGPVWLVVNYVAFRALINYGYKREAGILYDKTLNLLGGDYEKTKSLHEYYSPETGEPIMNPGFMNWNMLVLNMEVELRGEESSYDYIK